MSDNYSVELERLNEVAHIAQAYPSQAGTANAILLDPKAPESYQIKPINNGLSVCFYGGTLSLEQVNAISQQLLPFGIKGIQIVYAPEKGAEDAAVAWLLNSELSADVWTSLKQIALDNNLDVWRLATRPTLKQAGLLLMDMDSTTIKIECIDEIAKLAGVGEEVAKVTELAMQGKLDFAESLRGRVGTLKDADESIIAQVKDNLPLMHGLTRLIDVLKQNSWRVAIASGGFTYFADKLKDDLGLDAAVANTLEIVDGKLTGQVLGGIVDAQVKADTLGELAEQFSIDHSQTVAMGDGANDLVMMAASSLGVAFEAKPLVQEKADVAINFYGLDALLFILAR